MNIWLVIIIVLLSLFAMIIFGRNGSDIPFIVSFVTGIVSMIALLSTAFFTANIEVIGKEQESSIPICAIADSAELNGKIHGNMFYLHGYINETEYIQFIIKDNGGKQMRKVTAENVTFFETGETPHVATKREYYGFIYVDKNIKIYEFYVPYETVTNDFIIDLN